MTYKKIGELEGFAVSEWDGKDANIGYPRRACVVVQNGAIIGAMNVGCDQCFKKPSIGDYSGHWLESTGWFCLQKSAHAENIYRGRPYESPIALSAEAARQWQPLAAEVN